MHHRCALFLAASSLLAGCATEPPHGPAHAAAATADRDYVLVELLSGPAKGLDEAAQQQVFAGHMANIQRLAAARQLLVAGPFGEPRRDPARRGIFVFDTQSVAEAEQWTATDPGMQAGVFAARSHTLRTAAPLRQFLERELADLAARKAEGKDMSPGANIRGYVMLTADGGAAARAALQSRPGVLLHGIMDGSQLFAVLDAATPEDAAAIVEPVRAQLGAFVLDGWWASKGLAAMSP